MWGERQKEGKERLGAEESGEAGPAARDGGGGVRAGRAGSRGWLGGEIGRAHV